MDDIAYRLLGALSRNRAFRGAHRELYRLFDGRGILGRSLGVDTILLTAVGRRTGRDWTLPLYAFRGEAVGLAPGSWAVVGTNGGAAPDPAWLLNVRAAGRAVVRHRAASIAMRCRDANADEWNALWPVIVTAYPGYAGYRARRSHGAPIVILEPLGAATGERAQ